MMQFSRQSSQLLMSDLVENILRFSDNPGECARFITAQIRELVGIRSVAIFASGQGTPGTPITVCPERKKELWELPEVCRFVDAVLHFDKPSIISGDSEAGKMVAPLGITTSFIIPLSVGIESVGVIILLDLLDIKGTSTILETFTGISPILALILRNSFLYKNMENLVNARTIQLAESEERLRRALDNAPFPIMIHAEDGEVIMINTTWTELTGYTHHEIPTTRAWIEKAYREKHSLVKSDIDALYSLTGKKNEGEYQISAKNGTTLMWDFSSASLGKLPDGRRMVISMAKDVTAGKRLEAELQKVQKLESLGILAGGIAHDFNNLMGGIFGYIDLAKDESDTERRSTYLSKALSTIDRARSLTLQLLTFAKGGTPVQKTGMLFPFVQETAEFALSGSNVSCTCIIPDDLWPCNFDRDQIGQVIDNLIINAQQAMPVGGTIEIAACNLTISETEHAVLKKGNYVKLSVKDSGIGIPPALLDRIFDPFFTTKPKGHGLGLATAYSIVKRHEGFIDVESEPGKGSTFHLYLPAAEGKVVQSEQAIQLQPHHGRGIFVVMDDEKIMRETLKDMLMTFGYTVVTLENGQEALDYLMREPAPQQPITGAIFDLTIPGAMGGIEAVQTLRKSNFHVPVIVSSGYSEDPVMKNPQEYGFTASMCKPFRKSDLSVILEKYFNSASN